MKWVLAVSILLNVALGLRLWAVKTPEQVVPLERTIIETHADSKVEKPQEVVIKLGSEQKSSEVAAPSLHSTDLDHAIDHVALKREEFLTRELGLSTMELEKIESVKKQFHQKFQSVLPGNAMKVEMTLEERKRFLEIETEREKEFERILGKKRFQKFQRFKQAHNEKMMKRQLKGKSSVFVPIDL